MEANVEQKLKALYELQTIHSSIDKIRTVRGELPMEVADLEDDVAGLETRIHKIKDEINELEDQITSKKNLMKSANQLIKKYEEQQNNVKNNREFEALAKEMQYLIDNNIKDKGEFQFTSALQNLSKNGAKLMTGQVKEWLDCGNKNVTVQTNQRYLEFTHSAVPPPDRTWPRGSPDKYPQSCLRPRP